MNTKIKNTDHNLLQTQIGERIVQRRELLGYSNTHSAWKAIKGSGVEISLFRYERLESGEIPKTTRELYGVSEFLDISVQCWLAGVCDINESPKSAKVYAFLHDLHDYTQKCIDKHGLK